MEHQINGADGSNLPRAGEMQPYDSTMVGGSGPGKKSYKWIWVIVGAVLVAAITVVILWAVGTFATQDVDKAQDEVVREGNIGVWAVYNYCDQQLKQQKALASKAQTEIGELWLKEPFEFEGELELESELFETAGIPMSSFDIDLDAKYDMKNLGVKLSTMGFVEIGAYLIGDEFVVDAMGDVGSTKIDLPFETDLSKSMSLEERIMAFFPFLPEDEDIWMVLLTKLAVAVPDEMTEVETVEVYSPLDKDEVEMKAITTKIDQDGLVVVLNNLIDGLRSDEQMMNELQDMIDGLISFYSIKVESDVDLKDGLDELEDAIKDLGGEEFEFSWTVYERDGSYVGYRFHVNNKDTDMEAQEINEYDGNECYGYVESNTEGVQEQRAELHCTFEDEAITFDIKGKIIMCDYTGEETTVELKMSGSSEVQASGKDEYEITADVSFEMDMGDILPATDSLGMGAEIPDTISFDITFEGEMVFGDDLKPMEDSKDWDDIFDEEWGDLDDLMSSPMGGMGSML